MATLLHRCFQPPRALTTTLACLTLFLTAALRADEPRPAAKLELQRGDHICLIGNTLADRMQHDGWLEAYLHSRFPTHDFVIRNLGFSGDELTVRLRSMDFGTPDQWLAGSAPVPQPQKLTNPDAVRANRFELTNTKADVIFAFFGYNESFAGEAGLGKFKQDLEVFIKHTLSQKYNRKSTPRLVLFSPIAHEDLKNRNVPEGRENNRRIELYTRAMAEVARANSVRFVDLFKPTREAYARADTPLTENGVHLLPEGNHRLAQIIDRALFPEIRFFRSPDHWQSLRDAVRDKNFYWYQRYRATDGYSTFGDRAFLRFQPDDQSNYEVVQRELEALDVMTSNRDKRIWAVAQGKELKVDDSNLPPFIPVKTNKPGSLPGGKHVFLDPQDAIAQMKVAPAFKVNLFASEKDFPELVNPVQMSWDPKGRLWVAVWSTYPHWKPTEEMNDKLLILEDTDGDGKADKCLTFADRLHNPTGFEFAQGGVLIAQAPDLVFLKDTDGDDKADVRRRVLHGLDTADTHHTSNSFALDPGGAVYFQEGTFHHTQVETPYGPPVRCANAGVFRYEPRTQKFEVYISHGFANPHGHVFDRWGQDIVVDGTGAVPYHAALFSGHLDFPHKHAKPPQVYDQWMRPCPGIEILSSRHFPPEMQGNLLVANVIGYQGILQYKIADQGASFAGTETDRLLLSTDPNFRPSDLKVGPDGAIYFIDWHNPIIGHMQHNLRDPSRDREHGRVYRITYEGRPLLKPVKIAGEPIGKLLDLLKEPEDRVRYRARIELGGRDSEQVVAAVQKWADSLDTRHPERQLHLLEALWVHQSHNIVNGELLKRLLTSPDFRARAAATRVLCYWRDRLPETLDLLKKQAADPHPRVRLEAVRAASFFGVPEAVEVVVLAAELPTDRFLDFVRAETMKALDPYWKRAIAEGKQIAFTSDAGARFLLRSLNIDELLKMKRTRPVYLELLLRGGLRDEVRKEALIGLAALEKKTELRVLLDALQGLGARDQGSEDSVLFDLVRLLTSRPAAELVGVRPELEKMATAAPQPVVRELGFVALIAADGGVDRAWDLATKSVTSLQDLVNAMPLVRDPGVRASLYPKVEPLLRGLPKELAGTVKAGKGTQGRYVRIELPGRRKTLTLAEVEVYSEGRNVARQGKATQKNTAHGGNAAKAIDGNKAGIFAQGGQTHSEDNTQAPWWEVDLGREFPIDRIAVHNRTDPDLGKRLEGFTLQVLDTRRQVVYQQTKQPAPARAAEYTLEGGSSPEAAVRRAAMIALTYVRGQEGATFKSLARFVRDGSDRHAAIQALQRIPAKEWPQEEVRPLLDSVLAYVGKLPAQDRTSPEALDALQLGDALASLLPVQEARQVRKQLGELGVRVLRLGTLPEQMLFDKERLVVQAGKPVEFVFENSDLMPHNFVIVQPGALEEVGNLAEATATQPGAAERQYVPPSNKVLLASRLLQPREVQKLAFTAPSQPGVYPYVCTYPGHWRRMFGALYVVADLDEYQADAEAYLAKHPLLAKDELLKFNRPRKEWKFDELAGAVEKMDHGRSFAHGKQLFQVANCVACHKLNGVGYEIGPDLTKIDPKLGKPVELLRELLDPSGRINEKYFTYVFETNAGKVVTGLIFEETPDVVKVIENPLAKSEPVVLKKSDIADRKKSDTSIMPKGLLDKLTHEEILDLIAYVAAGGDAKHKLFQGGGHGHGPGH